MGARTSPVETRISPVAKAERVGVLDVLRGFALLGILMVNMASFRGPVFGEAAVAAGGLDRAATFLVAFAFEQKFYVLFSFLFGYGLSVQMFRAAAKGTPFVPRYLRRLLGLFLIGVSHAVLLYTGDILVTYALLGVILLLLRNARDRTLIVVAAALVTLTALMFVAGGILLGAQEGAGFGAGSGIETERSVEAYRGTPAEVVAERVREYPGALGFALLGQGPTALAMFLVGLWAGRRRLFERVEENLSLFRRVLAVGLLVGVPGVLVWAVERTNSGFAFDRGFFLASAVDFATAPFLTAVYVAALTLLYQRSAWRVRLRVLAPVGRAALSNYPLQSLVAAMIFTAYGLALYGRVGAAAGFVLGLAIFAAQVPLSAFWMRRFDFGPAEWALRSFTYAHLQPLRTRAGMRGQGNSVGQEGDWGRATQGAGDGQDGRFPVVRRVPFAGERDGRSRGASSEGGDQKG